MPNLFLNIPVPSTTGVGAAVDVSKMGATKTFIVGGSFSGLVTLECSTDDAGAGPWAPIKTFQGPGRFTTNLAAHWVRATMKGQGSANADVGGTGTGSSFIEVGALPVDISTLAPLKTVVAPDALVVEVSEDGIAWSQLFLFQAAGMQSSSVLAQFARVQSGGPVWMGGASIDDGAGEAGWPPFPTTNPTEIIIYARTTGSDETGDGTLTTPYRTFQRAIRDVPGLIPPGYIYTVDITDLGTEVLPANYAFPPIFGSVAVIYAETGNVPYPFRYGSSFNVRAFPQPASNIPLADTTIALADIASITFDPVTDLATITLTAPRASWAADALKGKFALEDTNVFAACAISGSDATHLYLCVDSSRVAGGLDWSVVETSATLQGEYNAQSNSGAIEIGVPFIALQGLTLRATDPDGFGIFSFALGYASGPFPEFVLCDIEGIQATEVSTNFQARSCVLRNKAIVMDAAAFTVQLTLSLDIPYYFVAGTNGNVTDTSVYDGCPALSGGTAYTTLGSYTALGWDVVNSQFKNGIDPKGAIWALNNDLFNLQNVQIDNPAGPGITVEGASCYVVLENVAGTSLDYGVVVQDGGAVRVLSDDVVLDGATSDMKVGTLANRTWADFRANPPVKNQYDIVSPPVGDEATGAGSGGTSGSRLFQRPA